jgi:membrane protein YqaA with SNARE-associated domain
LKLFTPFYERAMRWAQHPRAPTYLGALSFAEAVVFPVPPEVMLVPMTLARPRRGMWFASISLFWSMLGALLGYAIGYYAIDLAMPLIERLGYADEFEGVKRTAADNGFWFLLIGGFTPIPFKLLTLASGAVHMPLLPFLAGAIIGRGKRVYLVAGLVMLGGERAERALHRYIEPVGWIALALLVVLVVALRYWHS